VLDESRSISCVKKSAAWPKTLLREHRIADKPLHPPAAPTFLEFSGLFWDNRAGGGDLSM
jgi:hypothetical protein